VERQWIYVLRILIVGGNNMKTTKNVNKIIMLLFLVSSMCVSACSDTGKQNKAVEKPQFKTKEEAISSTYKSFLYEKKVCQNFVSTIAEDKEFIKTFESLDYREREPGKRVFQMLSKSKVAKNEIIQYLLRNNEYFEIDITYHPMPDMTYVKDSPIFCRQTYKRLEEIENYGPSEQAWNIREYFLNFDLEDFLQIGMPWHREGIDIYDFETLKAKIDTAKKLYTQQFKEPLKNWVQKASMQLRKEMENGESYYDGLIKEEKNKSYYLTSKEKGLREVEGWIAELNKRLE
jgi:hypothetical protein